MTRLKLAACAAIALAATAAVAHQGVKNPVVQARMHAMGVIADNTKVLGQMAKGEMAFDAAAARAAAAEIATHARRIPNLFEQNETDPKSEALPVIWDDFADFTSKGQALAGAANDAAQDLSAPDDLGPALGTIGSACKSCHQIYRK